MNVARQDDFLVGSHRGHDHRDDATGCSVDEEKALIGPASVGQKPFRFENDSAGFGQVVEANWGVDVAVEHLVSEKLRRGVDDVAHVMSGNVERYHVFAGVLFQCINEGGLSLICLCHNSRPILHAVTPKNNIDPL